MMSPRTTRQTARRNRRPAAWRRWAGVTVAAAAATVTTAAVLASCGHQSYRPHQISQAQPAPAAPTSQNPAALTPSQNQAAPAAPAPPQNPAVAANSGCVQATPVIGRALGVMGQLQRGAMTAAAARPLLMAGEAAIGRLARTTSDDILKENLAETSDAFTAFLTVLQQPNSSAYQQTFTDLAGKLAGFGRMCSVGNSDFETGVRGWTAATPGTALSRSPTAHQGHWSLEVTNSRKDPARTGFTDSPSSVTSTLKGTEQIGLWARALTGTPTLTLQVREMSGSTVLGSQQVTMTLDTAFRFANLTYQVKRPGHSTLKVTVWADSLAPGASFLVDDITIVRD
jgi:hypothetical protein